MSGLKETKDIKSESLWNTSFMFGKSELKYFEASIVNTITVACDNSVYSKIIEDAVKKGQSIVEIRTACDSMVKDLRVPRKNWEHRYYLKCS